MLQCKTAMDRSTRVRRTLIAGVLAAVALAPRAAGAQTRYTLVPSISVSAVHDDNIFTTEQRSGDQSTLLGPSLQALVESPRSTIVGLYAFDMLRSASFAALNNIEARRHGMFDAQLRPSEKLGVTVASHYDRADNSADLNFFDSALLQPRRRAQRWDLTPAFSYRPSTNVTYRGSYTLVREGLEGSLIAYEHVARGSYSRQLTERGSLSGGYLGRHFINGDDTQTSHAALLGYTWRLSPHTMLTLVGGPRLSSRGVLAPEITASLGRRAPGYWGYAFDYWRGESIILGVLGPVEVQAATGKFTYPILRNVEIGTTASYFKSQSQDQGGARVYHTELVASWSPKSFYSVAASYGIDFQHGDIRTSLLSNRDVERHVFLVKLTVAPRLSRQVQPRGPIDPLAGPSRRENNRDQ
jgi:hypothetical protein